MRLLLVEDDMLLGDGVRAGLKQEGYAVDWLTDGEAAWAAFTTDQFDLMVLDLGLPGLPGLELLERLRKNGHDLPVLILTARDAIEDRVKGLDGGADDYLTKPFDLEELSARLRALSRRRAGRSAPLIRNGELELDPAAHTVSYAVQPVELSNREFALLHLLLDHAGEVMTRARLEEALYGWDVEVESNTLEVYVHRLRRKIKPSLIRTVRGVGYLLEKESE
ncbi:response regulator [Thiohalomonas denitrificans]|uniref:response regulator n=1 Tax=Thiohalomonas denitrificans TaxID=415747 RepID=UPI0026F2B84C|nr:response regulator [Thiohalomonas denitrificans]